VRDDDRTDAELIAASAREDGAAFGLLVRRYLRTSTLLAAQLLGDRDDAEDVVQEAFALVYGRAREFDGTRPFSPWLYSIVRRIAENRRMRERRRLRLLRTWGGTQQTSSFEPASLARVDAEAVQRAMRALPPLQRACFELVVMRDLAPAEVATMHEIAESTVRQHVFRARRALRSALGKHSPRTGAVDGDDV
jgi:RNA polymerase sigma-70 factor (ECF subfamily)